MSDSLKIAIALEKLVAETIDVLDAKLWIMRVPQSVRMPMWEALARRATQNAEDCRETEG